MAASTPTNWMPKPAMTATEPLTPNKRTLLTTVMLVVHLKISFISVIRLL
jgi:hypothetical protein